MYIYGKNVCHERILNNEKIYYAILVDNYRDMDIIQLLRDKHIEIRYKNKRYLDDLTDGLHQGIVLSVPDYKTDDLEEVVSNIKSEYPLLVMLDHLEDPHNFGAIIRTCEALGVDAIIIPRDRSVSINATVIKTSAGAISYVKIIEVVNLSNTIKYLKDHFYYIVGSAMDGKSFNEFDFKRPVCLVVGNEGKGLSRLVHENCDDILSIKMCGKTNSLNASVATGIMLSKIIDGR